MTIALRLDRLEARAEIGELLSHFAHGYDRKDVGRFLGAFHEDATWSAGPAVSVGHGEIEAMLQRGWDESPETHHWIVNATIELIDPDHATGDAHTLCALREATGAEALVAAYYELRYARRAGSWRIASLQASLYWAKQLDLSDLEV